jgi:hypothetical protein
VKNPSPSFSALSLDAARIAARSPSQQRSHAEFRSLTPFAFLRAAIFKCPLKNETLLPR